MHGGVLVTVQPDRQSLTAAPPLDPRLVRWLLAFQFEINTVSSVAIEYPSLRPYAKTLRV